VTQQAVERALGKLLSDENFLERFFAGPDLSCCEAGFALSSVELEALSQLSHEALARCGDGLDKRISRPSLAGIRAPEAWDKRPHACGKWPHVGEGESEARRGLSSAERPARGSATMSAGARPVVDSRCGQNDQFGKARWRVSFPLRRRSLSSPTVSARRRTASP